MPHINWLHLSDWHQRGREFDRSKVAKRLLADIAERAQKIDSQLENIDFVVFSGDIAFSGQKEEFELANQQLIKPLRDQLGPNVPIYFVPGNHDITRSEFSKIPTEWAQILSSENNTDIEQLLQDPLKVATLNKPLKNFYDFAEQQNCKYDSSKLHRVDVIQKGGISIGIVCLNTAWLSARCNIKPRAPAKEKEFWDRGVLRTTEAQISDALDELRGKDIVIAIMHHPLHWLEEVEQAKAEQLIGSTCHIVLNGHEHRPNMNRLSNAFGDVVTIPAGASYYRRMAEDPRYTNAYNFCSVNLDSDVGTIFHRLWVEEKDGWRADERFWADGRSLFFIQKKQGEEQQKIARTALNQLSKHHLEHIYKRPALLYQINMRHELETINGETFLKAHVHTIVKLRKGESEQFPIRSLVNRRIVSHPDPDVQSRAHKLLKLFPAPTSWERDGSLYQGFLSLGPNDQDVEYEFEMLETTDGLYYFNLRRFTENVEFNLVKDPDLEYEDLPFGGFPSLEPTRNGVFRADTWKTKEPAMPNQGLVLQWYPKRQAMQSRQHQPGEGVKVVQTSASLA